jgi:hypothetical protein
VAHTSPAFVFRSAPPISPASGAAGQCGAALTQSPLAGNLDSPESYTPKHVAEKILIAKSALEGERKQVTMLFCDLANSGAWPISAARARSSDEVRRVSPDLG